MKTKRFTSLLIIVALMAAGNLLAQGKTSTDSEKQGIAIVPFDYVALSKSYGATETYTATGRSVQWKAGSSDVFSDADQVKAFADAATEKVTNAFVKLKRFKVLSRKDVEKLMNEQNFQMSDNVNMESAVQMGNMLGAAFMVMGQMQNVSATEIKDEKGKSTNSYTAKVEIQLRIVDIATGEILASKDFKGDKGEDAAKGAAVIGGLMKAAGAKGGVAGAIGAASGSNTPANAAFAALNEAEKKIYEWAKTAFPVEGEIFEILKEDKKGAATSVNITCGKDIGVKKGDAFKVYIETEMEVAGKMRKKTTDLGRLVVKNVAEDGWSSECEVEKGGKVISDNFKNKTKMMVVGVKK
jgi:curli biogenesis system outer membrane secretion channel CsgG